MAIVVTNNYFRNAFSAGSKPRILIEIGRDYDETRGHFKYPTFFRNFCYGGDLRIENIHIQESSATPIASDNNVLLYDHVDTSLLVNSENMSRIYSTSTNSFDTTGSIQGISSNYYKPSGVFTRGDTIELLDRNSGAFVDRSFIVGGSESGTTGVKKDLFSGDVNNRLFIKTPADISNVNAGYAYTINRDYFDEVTSPPVFQNSIDRLGGFASSGSVSFSLSNIKSSDTRQNWQQSTNEDLSDFWSQFLYNQTGDMLDNIQSIDDDWGIENSEVRIYMVYCEDTAYRGKCKITRTNADKITQLFVSGSEYHKWTFYGGGAKLLKSTDKLILHNKVSDGSVDANCISYTIDPSETTYNSINIGDNFTVGSDHDEYYYSIKRKDSMSWEDYYTGRMLMFNGKITTVSGISKSDITFIADSKSYSDIKDKTFGWEKIENQDYGINRHLFTETKSFGGSNKVEDEAIGATMPIFFGDNRLFYIDRDMSYANIAKYGLVAGTSNFLTPIKLANREVLSDKEYERLYDSQYVGNTLNRWASYSGFFISKYPLFVNEAITDGDADGQEVVVEPKLSGRLTYNAGGLWGKIYSQRFLSCDNVQGTMAWCHIDDVRTDEEAAEELPSNAWSNLVYDVPRIKWAILPNRSEGRTNYVDGLAMSNSGIDAVDYINDPYLLAHTRCSIYENDDFTGNSTTANKLRWMWDIPKFPSSPVRTGFKNQIGTDYYYYIKMDSTWFLQKGTDGDYAGWSDAPAGSGGLYQHYLKYVDGNIIPESFAYVLIGALDSSSVPTDYTIAGMRGFEYNININRYDLFKSIGIRLMPDNTGDPVNEGNIGIFIDVYGIIFYITTGFRANSSAVKYNGYGSPIGDWCTARNSSDGYDETHVDNLTVRVDSWTSNADSVVATTALNSTNFNYVNSTSTELAGIHNKLFSTSSQKFTSVVTGDLIIYNKDSTIANKDGQSGLDSLTPRTPSWATMAGMASSGDQRTNGLFTVGRKKDDNYLYIHDSQTHDINGYHSGIGNHWELLARYPGTYPQESGTNFNITNPYFKIVEGKLCLNPVTQLEQLFRWELFWDSTAIDENSFNTASNDRSDWEGFMLIQSELPVQGYTNTFCQSMGMTAWISANGKLKVKAPNVTDPYSATQVNSRTVTGTTVSSGNAPTETLNMCSSDPHIGFKFDFDYRYQCSTGELSTMRLYETNSGTSVYANFTSADNTNDPITAASKLAAKLTANSPTSWTYTVIFDYDTQKFTIDAGSGHTIYAIGEVAADETGHDSLCNLFGFYKVYRTVGARTLTSDFPISTLSIHGHMIVKDSFSISKSTTSNLANEVTVKYNVNRDSVTVSNTSSISRYGTISKAFENAHILVKDTATLYANFLLDKLSVPKVTVNFAIAGASGIVFEVSDYICIAHELLQSIYGKTYNSHGGGVNPNTKFRILSTSYGVKSNKVQIVAEEV